MTLNNEPSYSLGPEDETWLDQYESDVAALREPMMDKIIEAAKAASTTMQLIPSTMMEREIAVNDLTTMWEEWRGEMVLVKGKVQYEVKTEDGATEKRYAVLWETPVISNGFVAEVLDRSPDSDKSVAKVLHHISVPHSSIPEQFEDEDFIAAVAELDDLIIDTNQATPERAGPWLESQYPELVVELRSRLGGVSKVNESIEALKDVRINSWIDVSNELARNCVESYLQKQVKIDKRLPYGLVLEGRVSKYDEDSDELVDSEVSGERIVARLSGVGVLPQVHEGEIIDWNLAVLAKVYFDDRKKKPVQYVVPLSAIESMVSMHDLFYGR